MNTSQTQAQCVRLPQYKDIDFQKAKVEQRSETTLDDSSEEDPEERREGISFRYNNYG